MGMIRQVKISELPLIFPLAAEFYNDADIPGRFVPEVFIKNWTAMIEDGTAVVFGLFKDDQLAGVLGGATFPNLNSGELMAMEFFWFVSKEHRGSGTLLLDEFEAWAKARNVTHIVMAYLTSSMPEAVKHIYEKRGYGPREVHYMLEVSK
jgi:GNAT superfamily N-acetyltransferase